MIGLEKEECACCKLGKEAALEQEKKMFEKYGWIIHCVMDEPDLTTNFNFHTHGIPVTWPGAMDIQIIAPLPTKMAHGLACGYVDLLKEGKRFKSGDTTDGIIEDMKVLFMKVTETRRKVLRMILPDKKGNLEREKMKKPYVEQWEN